MAATATREEIESRVFKALEEFGAEPDLIGPDAEFEAMDVDSLDLHLARPIGLDQLSHRLPLGTPRGGAPDWARA